MRELVGPARGHARRRGGCGGRGGGLPKWWCRWRRCCPSRRRARGSCSSPRRCRRRSRSLVVPGVFRAGRQARRRARVRTHRMSRPRPPSSRPGTARHPSRGRREAEKLVRLRLATHGCHHVRADASLAAAGRHHAHLACPPRRVVVRWLPLLTSGPWWVEVTFRFRAAKSRIMENSPSRQHRGK